MAVMQIKRLRIAAGLTQEELGARLGVIPSMVRAWERETYLPQARQLPALAIAMGCGIEELFETESEEGSVN